MSLLAMVSLPAALDAFGVTTSKAGLEEESAVERSAVRAENELTLGLQRPEKVEAEENEAAVCTNSHEQLVMDEEALNATTTNRTSNEPAGKNEDEVREKDEGKEGEEPNKEEDKKEEDTTQQKTGDDTEEGVPLTRTTAESVLLPDDLPMPSAGEQASTTLLFPDAPASRPQPHSSTPAVGADPAVDHEPRALDGASSGEAHVDDKAAPTEQALVCVGGESAAVVETEASLITVSADKTTLSPTSKNSKDMEHALFGQAASSSAGEAGQSTELGARPQSASVIIVETDTEAGDAPLAPEEAALPSLVVMAVYQVEDASSPVTPASSQLADQADRSSAEVVGGVLLPTQSASAAGAHLAKEDLALEEQLRQNNNLAYEKQLLQESEMNETAEEEGRQHEEAGPIDRDAESVQVVEEANRPARLTTASSRADELADDHGIRLVAARDELSEEDGAPTKENVVKRKLETLHQGDRRPPVASVPSPVETNQTSSGAAPTASGDRLLRNRTRPANDTVHHRARDSRSPSRSPSVVRAGVEKPMKATEEKLVVVLKKTPGIGTASPPAASTDSAAVSSPSAASGKKITRPASPPSVASASPLATGAGRYKSASPLAGPTWSSSVVRSVTTSSMPSDAAPTAKSLRLETAKENEVGEETDTHGKASSERARSLAERKVLLKMAKEAAGGSGSGTSLHTVTPILKGGELTLNVDWSAVDEDMEMKAWKWRMKHQKNTKQDVPAYDMADPAARRREIERVKKLKQKNKGSLRFKKNP